MTRHFGLLYIETHQWNFHNVHDLQVLQRIVNVATLWLKVFSGILPIITIITKIGQFLTELFKTRCSAIAERPRCRMRYSFGQKWKNGTGRQYFTDIIGLSSTTVT